MKKKLSLLLLLSSLVYLHGYEGEEEVETVFAKIHDLSSPTLEEYRTIEEFLKNGQRPYLLPLIENFNNEPACNRTIKTRRIGKNLKLVGDHDEMPLLKLFHLNNPISKDRCILLYASYNAPYPDMVMHIVTELEKTGYQGDVLVRIGGYPLLENEGIKLCHIPYIITLIGNVNNFFNLGSLGKFFILVLS